MNADINDSWYEVGDDKIQELNDLKQMQYLINQIKQELVANNLDKVKHFISIAEVKLKVMFSDRLEEVKLSSSDFSERNMKALNEISLNL